MIASTILNYFGIEKTANTVKVIVSIVIASLLAIALLMVSSTPGLGNLHPLLGSNGMFGIVRSAGIWFFAFAGYSRFATLGEEVRYPETTIPRSIFAGLAITLFIYALAVIPALLLVGPTVLAGSNAPLVTAVQVAGFARWQWIVVVGSTFATLSVLLSLMTGISRSLFAMAADHLLPSYLAKVHPIHKVPHLAEVTVGLILVAMVLLVDVRAAIGFSSFTVLCHHEYLCVYPETP